MPPVGFEPTISAGEQPQTYALDRAATGTGDLTELAPLKSYVIGPAEGEILAEENCVTAINLLQSSTN